MCNHSLLSLVLCVLLSCIGCTPNALYRQHFSLCQADTQDCSGNSVIHYAQGSAREFYLGFTEFDDQGQVYEGSNWIILFKPTPNSLVMKILS